MRRHGTLQPLYHKRGNLTAGHRDAGADLPQPDAARILEKHKALDFSYEIPGMARFRSSVVRQRKGYDAVFRIINTKVRTMDELGLPEQLKVLTQYHNGLVLITGAVGCGKSTTLAAMVQEVNMNRHDHIITLEDPIEYVFKPAGCQITQREVRAHTQSFGAALRASLREDPDVIIVGEMRDLETICSPSPPRKRVTWSSPRSTPATPPARSTACSTPSPSSSRGRFAPWSANRCAASSASNSFPRADGTGRVIALEVMVNTPAVGNLIRDAKTFMLPGMIQTGKKLGMKMMDDSLHGAGAAGPITPYEAYDRAEQKALFKPLLN